jgi:hypothetical protein
MTLNISNIGLAENQFIILKKGEHITPPFSPEDEY